MGLDVRSRDSTEEVREIQQKSAFSRHYGVDRQFGTSEVASCQCRLVPANTPLITICSSTCQDKGNPTMDENWENTTKPSQIMREVLVIPKPGLGMLALFLGGLVVGGLMFLVGAGMGSPLLDHPGAPGAESSASSA